MLFRLNDRERLDIHYLEFYSYRYLLWLAEFIIYLTDITGLSMLYETLDEWINFNTRNLSPDEYALLLPLFGSQLNYKLVLIDKNARLFARKYNLAYVTFNTINCWGQLTDTLLVHEAVHCWQFQKYGSVYWFRALLGQFTPAGYNYGELSLDVQPLHPDRKFNFEQQAEIITDYYKLSRGYKATYFQGEIALIQRYKELLLG